MGAAAPHHPLAKPPPPALTFQPAPPRRAGRGLKGRSNAMFSHIMVGSNDLARSKKFYDATFGALGAQPGTEDTAKGRLIYSHNGGRFIVTKPIDGQPACHANGGTIGIAMDSPE